MKANNYIVLGISAVVAAFLLFLWYYLGFNQIDNPLDLVLAIIWWVAIVVFIAVILILENRRKRQIRTIYVSPTALYNSEYGVVGLRGNQNMQVMQEILENLRYNFNREDLPENDKFDYRYIVQTDEYKASKTDGEDPTWKGKVIKLDKENGNTEISFDDIDQLSDALAA